MCITSTARPMTYREALERLAARPSRTPEHAHHLPADLEGAIKDAYEAVVLAFGEAVAGEVYTRALAAADEGRDETYIAALILALLLEFRAERPARAEVLAGSVLPAYLWGFETGASAQLAAWKEEPTFKLTDPTLLAVAGGVALVMARVALDTLERHLAAQAAASALEGAARPPLGSGYLPTLTGSVAAARGDNEGRLALAQRSILGDHEKVWRHGPSGGGEKRRKTHSDLEGTRVPRGGMFMLGTLQVRHPHDWERAGINEWGGCHCSAVFEPAEGVTVDPWRGD